MPITGKEFLIRALDGTKLNTNPKTNPNPNTNRIQLFYAVFEHRPMIFTLASFVKFSHCSNMVLLPNPRSLCLVELDLHASRYSVFYWWRYGAVGSDVGQINKVTLRRARLVLAWVTVLGFNSWCGKFISV